jgi:hypothetical protein
MSAQPFPQISCSDLAFFKNGQIKTASPACVKALRHVRASEFDGQLVAGDARVGDFDDGAADAESIADAD